jgi:hypothetical protein
MSSFIFKNIKGPEAGFEPATEDPQSHMLPGYTTRAVMITFFAAIINYIYKICAN